MKTAVLIVIILLLSGLAITLFWSKETKETVSANLPDFNLSPDAIPDFKKWPVEKEGNVDADNDGKADFKLIYYLKEKEEAAALFAPFTREPYLLIFSRYSSDFFSFEDKIFYAVFENGRWEKVLATDKRVEGEFKKLHIKAVPSLLLLEAMLSGFNRRDSVESKKKDENKDGPEKKFRM